MVEHIRTNSEPVALADLALACCCNPYKKAGLDDSNLTTPHTIHEATAGRRSDGSGAVGQRHRAGEGGHGVVPLILRGDGHGEGSACGLQAADRTEGEVVE